MKKTILAILALTIISVMLIGCVKQETAPEEVSTAEIDQITQELDNAMNGDLAELGALDAELTELENLDLE